MLTSVAEHYGIDLETPWEELPENFQEVLLYGSGNEDIPFRYVNSRGHIMEKAHPFEGILPNLERRYRETESQSMREELARNLSTQPW